MLKKLSEVGTGYLGIHSGDLTRAELEAEQSFSTLCVVPVKFVFAEAQ